MVLNRHQEALNSRHILDNPLELELRRNVFSIRRSYQGSAADMVFNVKSGQQSSSSHSLS